jgi:hypothetical protein
MIIDARNIQVLENFFNEQSTRDQRGIFIAAYRKAVKPLVSQAKANAPVGRSYVEAGTRMGDLSGWHVGGGLRQSIGTKEVKNEVAIIVAAMRPKGSHGHLVEDGTNIRSYMTKKNHVRKNVGKVTATHFFENAFNSTSEQVYGTIQDEWYRSILGDFYKMGGKLK